MLDAIKQPDLRLNEMVIMVIPGHQPEMPDSVKLLLRDAKYLGIHTDCL